MNSSTYGQYSASDLNKLITLQQQVNTSDGGGGSTAVWQDVQSNIRANVSPMSAQQKWASAQLGNDRLYTIVIRYGIQVTTAMRIAYLISPVVYMKINGVINIDESEQWQQISAELQFQN